MASHGPSSNVVVPDMRRVVILADINRPDLPAVQWGSRAAHALGAEAVVVTPDEFASAELPPERAAFEQATTAQDVNRLAKRVHAPVDEVDVVMDDDRRGVDDAVVAMTNEHDVVVVGTDDVAGVTGLALGAEAHGLAHKLDCPLVAVPSSTEPSDGPIVIGLSGSDFEARSLAWAAQMGRALARTVVAVHAVDPMYDTFDNAGNLGADDVRAKQLAAATGVELVERYDTPDHLCRRVAADLHASLLVVSAKQHWTLGGRRLGRVADALLHEPPCPVAILTHDYIEE